MTAGVAVGGDHSPKKFGNTSRLERGNSFSLRLTQKIDNLIEAHLSKNQPRELFIPGLDDGGSPGGKGNIFEDYDPADGTIASQKLKTAKSAS